MSFHVSWVIASLGRVFHPNRQHPNQVRFVPVSVLFILFFSIQSGLCADPFPAQATSSEKIVMPEIVVTATRTAEEVSRIPANVSVITADELKKTGATTLPEALERLEGLDFRSYSGNASQSAIDIRGFGGDSPYGKSLILLDGRRLNRPDQASVNWLQIPITNIERIEVVRGAGSVLYGDSAIGGVINIITKRGEGKPKASASVTTGSYGLHDEQVSVTGSSEKLSCTIFGENQKSSGYRDRSTFSSQSAGLRFGYKMTERLDLDLGMSFNKTDYDLPGSLSKSQMEQDRRQAGNPDDDGAEKYYNMDLKTAYSWDHAGTLSLDLLYGRKDLGNNTTSWSSYNNNLIDTYGITPKYTMERFILGHFNKVVAGIDYYYETLTQDRYTSRDRTLQTATVDLTRESLGYYLRDEFNLLNNLILNAGLRMERTTLKGKDTDLSAHTLLYNEHKVHSAEAHEIGLTYLFGKTSKAYAKYATVYRIPFTDEQAAYAGYGSDTFLQDLEKEKGETYEIGTQFYPVDSLRIGLSLFRINMENEITYNYATWRNDNLDKTRHEGLECAIDLKLKTWGKLYGNFTYHRAEFRAGSYDGKTVPMVPSRKANAGLEIYLPYNLTLRPEIRYTDDAFQGGDNANTAAKIKSYTLYDLSLLYRQKIFNCDVSAYLGAQNLSNEKYELIYYNGYYPYPGFNLKGGVSVTF